MKKKLLFLIVFVLTIFSIKGVNAKVADVSIKSIELVGKEGKAEEISSATFNGMNINYNIMLKQPNDSIKYKVVIQNKGVEDIYINNKGEIGGSNYIVYDYTWDNNENIIKGYSEKTFGITITYKNEVAATALSNGSYEEAKNLVIKISDQKGNVLPDRNPKTDSNLSIFIILLSIEILAVMAVTIYLIKNKKLNIRNLKQMKKTNMVTAGIFLVLVLGTIIGYSYALEASEIKLDSKVKISKSRLARSCYSDSYTIDHYEEIINNRYNEKALSMSLKHPEEIFNEKEFISEIPMSEDYCLDWNEVIPNEIFATPVDSLYYYEPILNIVTNTSKEMTSNYNYEGESYELQYTKDVSDLQDGEVILGVYQNSDYETLAVIGQEGGVLAPVDSSWLFAGQGYDYYEAGQLTLEEQNEIQYDEDVYQFKMHLNEIKDFDTNVMVLGNYIELNNIDFQDTNSMSGMFAYNGTYSYDWYLSGIDKWNTSNVDDMSYMFMSVGRSYYGYDALDDSSRLVMRMPSAKVENINMLDTSNVIDMTEMFANAFNHETSFNISNWNTGKVKYMIGIFENAFNNLNRFDISKWNTSNVRYMSGAFAYSLNSLERFDISSWDVSKVVDMGETFYDSLYSVKELNLANWNVSKVENFYSMFESSLENATKLDLRNWNIKNNVYMDYMFREIFTGPIRLEEEYTPNIHLYINNIDFSKVRNYDYIFREIPYIYVHVKDDSQKNWILFLDGNDRPSSWNENNIIID